MAAALLRYRLTALVTATAGFIVFATASAELLRAQVQNVPPDVRSWVKKYEESYNAHKASAVAAFFSEDADMILGNGPQIVGREAIQEWWAHYFSRIAEERKGTFAIDSLRVIAPKVLLINLATTTAGRRSRGEELPTRLARGTWLVVRRDGGWRISALRAFPAVGEVRFRPGTDSSSSLVEGHAIEKVAGDALRQGPSTPGIVRHIAFQDDGLTVALAETEPGLASGWHNHTGHDVYGYVVSGTVRFESAGKMITVEPGGFFHVPPHTVHREFNPSTDKGKVVLFITGTGPLVENVSGAESAR